MSEVRWRDKRTCSIVAYESTTETDPETGRSVRRRKYLGTVDEETGELVPSLGSPGRRPGSRNRPKPGTSAEARDDLGESLLAAEAERDGLRERVRLLESELEARRDADERVRDMVYGLREAVSSL